MKNIKTEVHMLETSGLLLEENQDGSIRLGYVDYNVSAFGGNDYECFYNINAMDTQKLRTYFKEMGFLDLKEGLIHELGKNFSDQKFYNLCKALKITYEKDSWF